MFLATVLVLLPLLGRADISRYRSHVHTSDSLSVIRPSVLSWREVMLQRGAKSIYPVKLSVCGASLKVQSKYAQVLPIYTGAGSLYLAYQLRPGVNWLSGLPSGIYQINNQQITIY